MTGDRRRKTGPRSASALATVAALALAAMRALSLPLTVGVAGPASSATPVTRPMWLAGSVSGASLPLRSKARRLSRRVLLRASRATASPSRRTMPIPVAFEPAAAPAARLTDGEFGILPILRLSIGARQRGTDQATVDGTIFIGRRSRARFLFGGGFGVSEQAWFVYNGFWRDRSRFSGGFDELLARHYVGLCVVLCGLESLYRQGRGSARLRRAGAHLRNQDAGFLLAPRGHTRLLVFMVRIARGAARLLHLILDHRHYRVVGDAALARTIVIQNVTEPKPALLH
jgi:hypothetical protein